MYNVVDKKEKIDQTQTTEMGADKIQNEEEDVYNILPEIFVDAKVLELTEASLRGNDRKECKFYEINGEVFQETNLIDGFMEDYYDCDDIKEFEIKEFLRNNDGLTLEESDVGCEEKLQKLADLNPRRSDAGKLNNVPKGNSNRVIVQNTPYGMIINSNIFLTVNEWNTIIDGDRSNGKDDRGEPYCVACDINFKAENIPDHIAADDHRKTLSGFQPLEEFDNVVRLINDKYHCAICNQTFDINDEEHLASQSHGQKMLASINKVSDIMNDFDMYKGSSDRNQFETRDKDCIYFNVNDTAFENSFANDENFNESFKDSTCNYDYSSSDEENMDSDTMNENIDAPQFSYADIARKPKTNTPNLVEIKLGDKVAKVYFYYWHMIIIQKHFDCYYCMACASVGPIGQKTEHCVTVAHLENLMKCPVVGYFKDYIFRKVMEKFYHCGHCNNLILLHQIEDHVEKAYVNKGVVPKINWFENVTIANKGIKRTPSASPEIADNLNKSIGSNKEINTAPIAGESVQRNNVNQPLPSCSSSNADDVKIITKAFDRNISNTQNPTTFLEHENGINRQGLNADVNTSGIPTEADTVVIIVFGCAVRVPILSLNFIHKQPNDYYCWLCQVSCLNGLIWHHIFNDLKHRQGITQSPFCPQYNINLIRNTKYGMHCVLCNVYMKFDPLLHFREPMHQFLLNRALGSSQHYLLHPQLGVPVLYQNAVLTPLRQDETRTNTPQSDVQTVKIKHNETVTEELGKQNTLSGNKNYAATNNDNQLNDLFLSRDIEVKVNTTKKLIDHQINNCDNRGDEKVKETSSEVNTDISDKKGEITNNNLDQMVNREEVDDIIVNKKVNESKDLLDHPIKNSTEVDDKLENAIEDKENLSNIVFDFEEFVYVKVKNIYMKITAASYNTLVPTGNGSRLCFVCSTEVIFEELRVHVDSKTHQKNILDNKFLATPEKYFLRQISTLYHCALCNVLIVKKCLQDHLLWLPHIETLSRKIGKNTRRKEIKAGIREIVCGIQNEVSTNPTDDKKQWTVRCNVKFVRQGDIVKKKKIIRINDIALKISWDAFHGLIRSKNGIYKCLICQMEFRIYELATHVETSRHLETLDYGFQLELLPAIIRQVNLESMHCLTCNICVHNTPHVLNSHLNGEKHQKLYKGMICDTSGINSNQSDILTLT